MGEGEPMGESSGHDPQKGRSQPWTGGRNPNGIERALSGWVHLRGCFKNRSRRREEAERCAIPPEIRLLTSSATELGESPNTLLGVGPFLSRQRSAPPNQRHSFRSWMRLAEIHRARRAACT